MCATCACNIVQRAHVAEQLPQLLGVHALKQLHGLLLQAPGLLLLLAAPVERQRKRSDQQVEHDLVDKLTHACTLSGLPAILKAYFVRWERSQDWMPLLIATYCMRAQAGLVSYGCQLNDCPGALQVTLLPPPRPIADRGVVLATYMSPAQDKLMMGMY